MAPVQFWFEFASTYSYVAALRIEELASTQQVSLEWKPFLLGPIFQRQGWDLHLYPVRARYMWRDVERQCQKYRLPFRRPVQFPRNSLLAARVACTAAGQKWLPEFVRAVCRANFSEDRDISHPTVIEGILRSMGQDGREILAAAQSPENKERLRQQTDLAWELGVFGAPTFVVAGEVFWGNDRLEDAFAWYKASTGGREA